MTTHPFEDTHFDALLFDMDGTILTSIPAVERAWTAWARRVGLPVEQVLAHMHGRRAVDTIRELAPPGLDIAAEVAWLDARELEDRDGILAIDGAADLLTALPRHRWAIVTSAMRELAVMRIEAAGLPMPDVLVTSDDVRAGKPDPEGYLLGARRLSLPPERCLVLEDTDAGLRAGLAAGAAILRIAGQANGDSAVPCRSIRSYREVTVSAQPNGVRLTFAQD